jgi:hypothetical protein
MKRLMSLFCLLLLNPLVWGQAAVKISNYPAKYVDVPAPEGKMIVSQPIYSYPSPIYWGETFIPGGQIAVSNALVDKQHKVGTWSQEAIVDVTQGWRLLAMDSNQPPAFNCVGVVWKIRWVTVVPPVPNGWPAVNGEYVFVVDLGGVGPAQFKGAVAWSGTHPKWTVLGVGSYFMAVNELQTGGANTTQAGPPPVRPSNIPQTDGTIAYCWVTHTGETALSTPTPVPAGRPGSGAHGSLEEIIRCDYYEILTFKVPLAAPAPMGALGFHVYYNGKRVRAPQCTGTPSTPDDWLWSLDTFRFPVYYLDADGPTHNPAATPKSWLNSLQVAMIETSGNIIVDTADPINLYCPIVDEYHTRVGYTNTVGTPFKHGRRISSGGEGRWTLVQQKTLPDNTTGYPTYWPGIVVYNQYGIWEDAKLLSAYGSVGVCFSDYSGGQAFGVQFNRCQFVLDGKSPQTDQPRSPIWITRGISVDANCEASGHSASELRCNDCLFLAMIPVWMEHIQTANVKFYRMHLYSPTNDRRACVFYINSPNQFDFKEGVFADCPWNIIFSLGFNPKVTTDGIWIDSGCKSVVDFQHNQPGSIVFNNAKMNLWTPQDGTRANLARIINTSQVTPVILNNVIFQLNYSPQVDICSPAWNRCEVRLTDSDGPAGQLVLREPTRGQWLSAVNRYAPPGEWGLPSANDNEKANWAQWQAFINVPEPGFKLTIPGTSFTPPPTNITITDTKIVVPEINETVTIKINGSTRTTTIPIKVPAKTVSVPGRTVSVNPPTIIVPSQSVVFNSLTGRQTVRRVGWDVGYSLIP